MVMQSVLERFFKHSPAPVTARLALQRALEAAWIDELFELHRQSQYTRELLFSTTVEIMSLVAVGLRPSVHAAESAYQLTLAYLPPEESRAQATRLPYENARGERLDWRERLDAFVADFQRFLDLLDGVMLEINWLGDSETLTYLHGCVSARRHPVAVPEVPMHLDALLTDEPLTGGLAPMLGTRHLRAATVRGLPASLLAVTSVLAACQQASHRRPSHWTNR